MPSDNSLIRPLSPIEQAFTISNDASPLVVVCVLHLSSGPEIPELENALVQLQSRHILLQAGIIKNKGQLYFQKRSPVPPLTLSIVENSGRDTCQQTTELALNTQFDTAGPLLKCWYLITPEKTDSQLIICFHHAIIDGTSARLILHELLSLCANEALPKPSTPSVLPQFPAAYRQVSLAKRLIRFGSQQMAAEWRYKKTGLSSPIPATPKNAVISLRLDPALSRKLSVRIGREGLSLNSVLLAAITQAVLQHQHPDRQKTVARAISFADLRSAMEPAVSPLEMGCYISMLRLEIPTPNDQSIWDLSASIRRAIFQASRRGEVFLMSIMSKHLVSMVFRLKTMRLGNAALSFIGKLDLQPQYGTIRLHEVQAFITNNRFGPEFSAFGKILFGSIGLDFTYLTAEIDRKQATRMVAHIKKALEEMAELPYF